VSTKYFQDGLYHEFT